jgi:phosphotriesterase-related protein
MRNVATVNGMIDAARLGPTLMHEHIFTMDVEFTQNYGESWGDEEARVEDAILRLEALRQEGIGTIVDLTVFGLGRYIPRIQRVAAKTSLNIVAATGAYTFDDVPRPFRFRGPGSPLGGDEPMVDLFVREIRDGIADTGVRAGILKCATGPAGITPGVERVLRAVAKAHKETGVPISTHSVSRTRNGLEQQRILADEGVDLGAVVIGHCGDGAPDYLREIIANGSYIGMDQFGIDFMSPFEDRVSLVAAMCAEGHADRMVLSHDHVCWADILDSETIGQLSPNWNYLHVSRDVLPELRRRGVPDSQIEQMLVINPRCILQGGHVNS